MYECIVKTNFRMIEMFCDAHHDSVLANLTRRTFTLAEVQLILLVV